MRNRAEWSKREGFRFGLTYFATSLRRAVPSSIRRKLLLASTGHSDPPSLARGRATALATDESPQYKLFEPQEDGNDYDRAAVLCQSGMGLSATYLGVGPYRVGNTFVQ